VGRLRAAGAGGAGSGTAGFPTRSRRDAGSPRGPRAAPAPSRSPRRSRRWRKRTNSHGEPYACLLALRAAERIGSKHVYGDGKLVPEFWSRGFVSAAKRESAPDLADLSARTTAARSAFERPCGVLSHVPGGVNPADLGFHRDWGGGRSRSNWGLRVANGGRSRSNWGLRVADGGRSRSKRAASRANRGDLGFSEGDVRRRRRDVVGDRGDVDRERRRVGSARNRTCRGSFDDCGESRAKARRESRGSRWVTATPFDSDARTRRAGHGPPYLDVDSDAGPSPLGDSRDPIGSDHCPLPRDDDTSRLPPDAEVRPPGIPSVPASRSALPPPTPNAAVPPNGPAGSAGRAEGESALDCPGSTPGSATWTPRSLTPLGWPTCPASAGRTSSGPGVGEPGGRCGSTTSRTRKRRRFRTPSWSPAWPSPRDPDITAASGGVTAVRVDVVGTGVGVAGAQFSSTLGVCAMTESGT
jgi:hypothetical protein